MKRSGNIYREKELYELIRSRKGLSIVVVIQYTGGGDWIINQDYAYIRYGKEKGVWFRHKEDWPDRIKETHWPRATQKEIRELIITIFIAEEIGYNKFQP